MSFQENLKYYREKAGYKTAKDFSEALSLPYATYAAYENKNREPKYNTLCKIADLLHVSTDELLGRKNNILGMNEDEQLKKEIQAALAQHEEHIKLELVNLQDKKTDFISFNIYTNDNKFLWNSNIKKADIIYEINVTRIASIIYKNKQLYTYFINTLINDAIEELKNNEKNNKNLGISKEQINNFLLYLLKSNINNGDNLKNKTNPLKGLFDGLINK